MAILYGGDPHGDREPARRTAMTGGVDALVLLGDLDPARPLAVELAGPTNRFPHSHSGGYWAVRASKGHRRAGRPDSRNPRVRLPHAVPGAAAAHSPRAPATAGGDRQVDGGASPATLPAIPQCG